jgi:CheY-like chemotaxis protein
VTVLVVDDEATIRELVAAILRRRGYRVYTAADGLGGLALVHAHAIDLVITDIEMPALSGRELASHVWRLRPRTPILFISGSYSDADLECNALGGPKGFLGKPFSLATLLEHVEDLLMRSAIGRPHAAVVG